MQVTGLLELLVSLVSIHPLLVFRREVQESENVERQSLKDV